MGDTQANVVLSGQKYPESKFSKAADLNTYSVMNAQCIVLSESAVNALNNSAENN